MIECNSAEIPPPLCPPNGVSPYLCMGLPRLNGGQILNRTYIIKKGEVPKKIGANFPGKHDPFMGKKRIFEKKFLGKNFKKFRA